MYQLSHRPESSKRKRREVLRNAAPPLEKLGAVRRQYDRYRSNAETGTIMVQLFLECSNIAAPNESLWLLDCCGGTNDALAVAARQAGFSVWTTDILPQVCKGARREERAKRRSGKPYEKKKEGERRRARRRSR